MTENIISIIFINPHFVNPKITKNPEKLTFFLLPPWSARRKNTCPDGSAHGQVLPRRASPSFPQFIHTVRHTRTNTSSIFTLSTRYVVTVINIIHNLWITLWITFLFAVYNLWVFPIFPVFTPCIMCISVFQTLHILFFSASYPQSYQHSISCYPQIILLCINRKIFYTFCG